MPRLLRQIVTGVRLNLRNRMALIYGYLFPAIFLLAFRTLYRQERVPLVLHAGELLTVTILGGACFGLPTGIVSERERGVWRRYKMLPAAPPGILAGTLATRYLLLLSAGLLQLILAMAAGMPAPKNLFTLWVAFSAAAMAFMGIGLDIAMLAPSVPAVQALGQCVFLPMLIVGGIAVPVSSLPDWAQHLSAYLPGRYSVEAIQAAVTGTALARFDLLALLIIGAAGGFAGILAFRWDSRQRPSLWLTLALAGWLVVGVAAQPRGQIRAEVRPREEQHAVTEYVAPTSPQPATKEPAPEPKDVGPATWQQVTASDIEGVAFERLPEDAGVVSPIAGADDEPDPAIVDQLTEVQASLPSWRPGKVRDPVQRVRNFLYAATVADVYRMDPLERFVPLSVLAQLKTSVPADDLPKILYFVAVHPREGSDSAVSRLHELGLPDGPRDTRTLRSRSMIYAFKFLGRVTRH